MKEFKGTPGPWINVGGWVDAKKSGCLSSIICAIDSVASINPESVNDANANLIAAAPELLEALRQLRDYVEDVCAVSSSDCDKDHPLMLANAAIKKALGE